MPSLGFFEIVLIFIVILLFVKPDDLPAFIRSIRKFYIMAHQHLTKIRMYTKDTIDELTRTDYPNTPKYPQLKPRTSLQVLDEIGQEGPDNFGNGGSENECSMGSKIEKKQSIQKTPTSDTEDNRM